MNIYDRAGWYISKGDKSIKDVRDYLKRKNYDPEKIEKVINDLIDTGYLNDERYAKLYIKYGFDKGWGKNKILYNLRQKGVSENHIEDAYYNFIEENNKLEGEIEEEKAMAIASKILRNSNKVFDEKLKRKIARRLASYGYSASLTYRVINRIESSAPMEEEFEYDI